MPDWHKEREQAAWSPGKTVAADQWRKESIATRALLHLADMGRPFALCETRIEQVPGANEAELVLTIKDAGPPAVIRDLAIEGLTRHTAERVQAFLGVGPGSPIDANEVERIRERLRTCCRMWKYDIVVAHSPSPAGGRYGKGLQFVDLRISVQEYDQVPPLGESLSAVDACLIRAAAWIEGFGQHHTANELLIEATRHGTEVRAVFSPVRGVVVRARHLLEGSGYHFDLAAVDGPGDQQLFDWVAGRRLRLLGSLHPQLALTFEQGEVNGRKYGNTVRTSLGASSESPAKGDSQMWTVRAEAVAFVNMAHREDAVVVLEDGVLTIKDTEVVVRFDEATGALIDAQRVGEVEKWRVHVAQGEFDRLRQEIAVDAESLTESFDDSAPIGSVAAFLIGVLESQPLVAHIQDAKLACAQLRPLIALAEKEMRLDELLATLGLKGARGDDEFVIPLMHRTQDGGSPGPKVLMLAFAPRLADALFPRESWAWTALRESGFALTGDRSQADWTPGVDGEMDRAFNRADAGPLGLLAMTRFGGMVFSERLRRTMAREALPRLDGADIHNDAAILAIGDHGLARIVCAAIRSCDDLGKDERARLTALTPDPWRGVVTALVERRASRPDEAPEASLDAALAEAWEGGLRDYVRAELERLSAPSKETRATIAQQPGETATE